MSRGGSQLFDPEAPPASATDAPPVSEGRARPGGTDAFDPAVHRDTHPDVLSVGGLYDQVEGALNRAFPRSKHLWIRGEIRQLSDHRSGHLYFDLFDPDDTAARSGQRGRGGVPTLHVKCWRSSWAPLRHSLAKEGIALAEGMVVVLRGSLDLYRAKGEVSLVLAEVDVTALLGQMAAQRAQLLRTLESEGLLRRNAALAVPAVPLHVGLVASPGTEGYHDFVGQLTGSGFGFRVSLVKVSVQGASAAASIARAVRVLSNSDCDVVAVVRGGGARADLAAFETEVVARAIAGYTKPVLTGIGHSGDETVADIVAARACITPTECGQAIVAGVRRWWSQNVAGPAELLARRVPAFLGAAESRDAAARARLTAAARHQLRGHRERLATTAASLGRVAPRRLESLESAVRGQASRLGSLALSHLGRRDEQVQSWRRLLAAYDVDRQLERGYSLTLTGDGALVRSAAEAAAAGDLVTRFADGTLRSRVEEQLPPGDVAGAATAQEA